MTEPFDRDLYSRVMADMPGYGDTTHYALGHRHGYEEAANVAARISAERQPVSDEDELWKVFVDAYHDDTEPDGRESTFQSRCVAGVRAVRAAITPQVPVSDEALWGIYHAAYCNARFHPDSNPDDLVPGEAEVNAIMAGIRAVRKALGPAVPVIPEGWQVDHAACCLTRVADQRDIHRTGSNWMAALTAAIEAAKESAQ